MTASNRGNIAARLDELPWTRVQTRIALALGAGWLFDSLEVNLIASVINPLQQDFGYGPLVSQFVIFSWLIGILLGAMLGGRLADRFGRRRLFVLTLLWYAFFTMLTAVSPVIGAVIVLRFLAGLGVGAEYSIINSAIAELMPARYRGKAGTLVMNFWPLGGIASGLLAYWLLHTLHPSVSWRYGFAIGGAVALLVLFFRQAVPESPRWLVSQGRHAEAEGVVARLERESGVEPGAAAAASTQTGTTGLRGARELLSRYPGRLALGCLLDLSEAFGYYGIFAMLPLVVFPAIDIAAADIPFFMLLGNVGALAGGVAAATVLDRWGRHRTLIGCYALAGLGVVALALATNTGSAVLVLVTFMVSSLLGTAAWTAAYPSFTELFPTHLRGVGVGISVGVGRIGAAFSVLVVTTVAHNVSIAFGYGIVVVFWAVGAAAVSVFAACGGVEAARKPLESVAAGEPGAVPAGWSDRSIVPRGTS